MNINDDVIGTLTKEISKFIKTTCDKLNYDKTYTGIVSAVNKDGYTVKYNGTDINIKTNTTDVFKKGDCVKFCIPCGNKKKAYFVVDLDLMKRYMDERIAEIQE